MSYMGPRFMGGGQIFPQQSQNPKAPFQQLQQQIQAMQRHMQQNMPQKSSGPGQMQNQPSYNQNSGPNKDNPGPHGNKGNQEPNQGPRNSGPRNFGPQGPQASNRNQGPPTGQSKGPGGQNPGQQGTINQGSQGEKNQGGQSGQNPGPPAAGPQNPTPKSDTEEKKDGTIKVEVTDSPNSNPPPTNLENKNESPKLPSLMGPPPPLMGNNPQNSNNMRNAPPKIPQNDQRPGGPSQNYNNSYNQRQGKPDQIKQEPEGFYDRNPQHAYNERNNQYNERGNYDNYNRSRQPSNAPNRNNSEGWGFQGQGRGNMNAYGKGPRGYFGHDRIKEKLKSLFADPLAELEPLDMSEKKFNVQSKLFVGNIPKNSSQEELEQLFKKYGEVSQVFLNKDASYAFVHFDYKQNAQKAAKELDNFVFKNRNIKVRFATIGEGLRVKNLSMSISNELLEKCFSIFGPVESCRIIVDERGMSKGEGIVIFREKKAAVIALKKCEEECFFLSGALRPAIVSPLEPGDDNEEGIAESSLPKNEDYRRERSIAPHFATDGSFEFDFGLQWKQLFHVFEEKKITLERDFKIEMEHLEKKMVLARVEYETEKLRKELAAREADAAQLRRHFGEEPSGGGGQFSSMGSSGYDDYGGKRPMDPGYDSGYNDPYDNQYGGADYDRNYRGGYDQGGFDNSYDRPYGGSYNRDGYGRSKGPAPGYDGPKQEPSPAGDRAPMAGGAYDTLPLNPDRPFDQSAYDREASGSGGVPPEPYKAMPKRPRY